MNIAQTRQVMSYIWATHPNAPRYTDEDKIRTVAAYFKVLYKYSIQDVLSAVDSVCSDNPTFIPSAYEIKAKCEKHVCIEKYLPKEYYVLEKSLEDKEVIKNSLNSSYLEAFNERSRILGWHILSLMSEQEKQELCQRLKPYEIIIKRYNDMSELCKGIKKKMSEIYTYAASKAYEEYDKYEETLACSDLKSIDQNMNILT